MRGLYAIVDPEHCAGRAPLLVAKAILKGGCACLQLRDKRSDDRAFIALGTQLAALCKQAALPFIVNDRVHLAATLGAAGVHIGQGDMSVAAARALVGPAVQIGVSTHSIEQAERARAAGADLIGFGPIFATSSKLDPDPVVGVATLARVCASMSSGPGPAIPVVAIGGITLAHAAEIARAGASYAAAIGAVCAAADPEGAARALHRALIA
jgi:thiamine-phosphate pyrophosphorylase